jgi:lysozyme
MAAGALAAALSWILEAFPPTAWSPFQRARAPRRHSVPAQAHPRLRALQLGAAVVAVGLVGLLIANINSTLRRGVQGAAQAAPYTAPPSPTPSVATPARAAAPTRTDATTKAPASTRTPTGTSKSQPKQAPTSSTPASTSDTPQPQSDPGPEYGVDVSNFNGDINWSKVAASGKSFAYVLDTDGLGSSNRLFDEQYSGAKDAGLFVGAYHFARPNSSAQAQADALLQTANYRKDGKTLPPMLDLEVDPNSGGCYGLSPSEMQDWVKTFTGRVKEATGHDVVLYANQSFWSQCMGDTTAFNSSNPLDLASYGSGSPPAPGGWKTYTFWQNSSTGSVGGLSGDVDLDVFNGGMGDLKKFSGK